jgi:hypothetical protein
MDKRNDNNLTPIVLMRDFVRDDWNDIFLQKHSHAYGNNMEIKSYRTDHKKNYQVPFLTQGPPPIQFCRVQIHMTKGALVVSTLPTQ